MSAAIDEMQPGNRLGDIGHAVQAVSEAAGFSVVREYSGHGIGTAMHEAPSVYNHGQPRTGQKLKAGMVLAVEPMVNAGTPDTALLDDGWSVVTADGVVVGPTSSTRSPSVTTALRSSPGRSLRGQACGPAREYLECPT